MYTEQVMQSAAIAAPIAPQTLNNSNASTGGIDMSNSKRAFFVVEVGAVAGGGSLTMQLIEDTAANLGTATNLAGNNVSLVTTSANKQFTFEARSDQMTKKYLGLKITETGSQNVVVCAIAMGMEGDRKPNNLNNDASVKTQNVVS
jgi:hypothetical protein